MAKKEKPQQYRCQICGMVGHVPADIKEHPPRPDMWGAREAGKRKPPVKASLK